MTTIYIYIYIVYTGEYSDRVVHSVYSDSDMALCVAGLLKKQ